MINQIAAIIIATSPCETPQPPCSFIANRIMDVLQLPGSNKQLAPLRVIQILNSTADPAEKK